MRQRWLKFRLISIIALSVFVVQWVEATTYTWTGSGSWNSSSNWNPSGIPNTTSDDVIFSNSSTSDCNIDINVKIRSITVNASYTGKITQNSGFTFTAVGASGTIPSTIGGGTFVGGDSDILFGDDLTISGTAIFQNTSAKLKLQRYLTYSSSGSFKDHAGNVPAQSGTVSFYQPIAWPQKIQVNTNFGNNIYHMMFEGTGGSQFQVLAASSPLIVNGNFTIAAEDATNLSIYSGQSITVKGTLTTTGTSSTGYIVINNTINAQGNVTINNQGNNSSNSHSGGTGTIVFNGTGAQSFGSTVSTYEGAMPNIQISKASGTVDLAGTITCSGNWDYAQSGNGANGVTLNTSNPSTMVFVPKAGNGVLTIDTKDASGNSMSFNNVTIDDAADNEATLGSDLTLTGNFSMTTGSRLYTYNTSNYNMTVAGNWSIAGTASVLYNNSCIVTFNGSSQQITTSTNSSNFYKLTINQSSTSSTVTLNNSVTVDNTLTLTKGIVNTTSSNLLILPSTGSLSGGSSSSFVDGPIEKIGNSVFTFPVGDVLSGTNIYSPVTISAPSVATDAFTVQYQAAAPTPTPVLGSSNVASSIVHISPKEYWTVSRTVGTSNVNVTVGWDSSLWPPSSNYATDPATMLLSVWNGSNQWINAGNSSHTGASPGTSGTLTVNSLSTYGNMTLGSTSDVNPLPIVMSSFSAKLLDNNVHLAWTTDSEINNDYFTVQRSSNGYSFADVLTVKSKNGNSNIRQEYSAVDYFPLSGNSYYRIAQTDFNNMRTYSEVIAVAIEKEKEVVVSPNPYRGEGELLFRFPTAMTELIQLKVKNASGNDVFFKVIKVEPGGTNYVKLDSLQTLSPGLYFVGLIVDGQHYHSRLLII